MKLNLAALDGRTVETINDEQIAEGASEAVGNINAELDRAVLEQDERQGDRVLQDVFNFLGRFISYPSEHAQLAHTLWCIHTHLMECWESTPRLAFLSPEPGSGKTRALEITELLVPNAVSAVNASPAYLFRKVGCDEGATILYDEIDTVFGPKARDNEEVRGFLNAGHRRGATFGRCNVSGKTVEPVDTRAYAAVALAGLGWLPDTILTRAVVVRMRRRRADEHVTPYRRRIHGPEGERLFQKIALWARSNAAELEQARADFPDGIEDRDADVWEALLSIAEAAGGLWPKRARAAAVAFVKASKDHDLSLGVKLLADVRVMFIGENMTSKTIVAELVQLEESPWGDIRGKPLDERGLARRLKDYGIKPHNVRVGSVVAKGYSRSDLQDAWDRYLPALPSESATSATSATVAPAEHDVADVTHVAHPGAKGGDHRYPCDFCDKPGELLAVGVDGKMVWLHRACMEPYRSATSATAATGAE